MAGKHRRQPHKAKIEDLSQSRVRKMTREELERLKAELQADEDDTDFPPEHGDLNQ